MAHRRRDFELTPDADTPEVAAAIARRKKTLDRQTLMAAIGFVVVAVIMNFDSQDHSRTLAGLVAVLPWIVGLTIAIFVLNRWTLSIQSKLLRRDLGRSGDR